MVTKSIKIEAKSWTMEARIAKTTSNGGHSSKIYLWICDKYTDTTMYISIQTSMVISLDILLEVSLDTSMDIFVIFSWTYRCGNVHFLDLQQVHQDKQGAQT